MADERLEWLRDFGVDPDTLDDKTASYARCFHCDGKSFNSKGEPCEHCKGSGLYRDDCLRCGVRLDDHFDSDHYFASAQDNGFSEDDFHVRNLAAKTRLVMPAVCPSCQSTETRGRYHRGGWREYTCLDCGSEFKNRDSRIAHVSDDKAMHHANPDQLRIDHPYWDECGTCGGDGIQVGSTDVLTGEQKQSPCKDCGGIGEAYDAEYWDSDDQLHDFANYPNFHQMNVPDKPLKTHLKDVHQTDKGYDDAYVQHQVTHGINVDPAIAEILMPKAAAKTTEFDRTKYDEVQHVDPRWIVKNVKPVDDPTWKQNFDWNDIEGRDFLDDVKANGVNEPVHTKNQMDGGGLEMANGHHRVWAAIRAGLASVPLIHHDEHVQLEDTEGEGLVGHTECRDYQNSKEASKTAVNRTRSWYLKQRDALVDQVGPDKTDTVHDFGDGWTIKHLNTVGDAQYEGGLMKNCIKEIGIHDCQDCNQYGDGENPGKCSVCGGSKIDRNDPAHPPCAYCQGTGNCDTCEGRGQEHDEPHVYIGDAIRGDEEAFGEQEHRWVDSNHEGRIYSLRDSDDIPHVSFTMHDKEDYDIDEGKGLAIENLYGRANKPPKPEHALKVTQFFKDATKDRYGTHTIEGGSIDHAIHVFGQHDSPSATLNERRGCRDCIDKHNREHTAEQSRPDLNCPECREPRLFAGSKTAEFTPGDTTYPFAENATPNIAPQPRGLDPWKDRGDNGVPLHNDMVFDPKLKKWINSEMSAMPAEVNYPGNGLMSQSSVPTLPDLLPCSRCDGKGVGLIGTTSYGQLCTQCKGSAIMRGKVKASDDVRLWEPIRCSGCRGTKVCDGEPDTRNGQYCDLYSTHHDPHPDPCCNGTGIGKKCLNCGSENVGKMRTDDSTINKRTGGGLDYCYDCDHYLQSYPGAAWNLPKSLKSLTGHKVATKPSYVDCPAHDKPIVEQHSESTFPFGHDDPDRSADSQYCAPLNGWYSHETLSHLKAGHGWTDDDARLLIEGTKGPWPPEINDAHRMGHGNDPVIWPCRLCGGSRLIKRAQTWTQSVDAPPNGGNVKRLPYDPYPEGKGETHTLDALPAPTGEDVKKWKTVKTFPGDKSFADHPQTQDRIDNMPQVVGAKRILRGWHGETEGSFHPGEAKGPLWVALDEVTAHAYAEDRPDALVHEVEYETHNPLVLDTPDKSDAAFRAAGAHEGFHNHALAVANWAKDQGHDAVVIPHKAFAGEEGYERVGGMWGDPQAIILDPARVKVVGSRKHDPDLVDRHFGMSPEEMGYGKDIPWEKQGGRAKVALVQVVGMALVNDDELPPKLRDTIEAFKTLPNVHRLQNPAQAAMRCGPASHDFAEFAASRGHQAHIRLLRDDTFQNVWKNNTQREHDEYQGSRHAVPYVDGHYVDWTARQYTPDSPVPRVYKNLKEGDAVGNEGIPFSKYFKNKREREGGDTFYGLMKFQEGAEEWDPSYRNPEQKTCKKHATEWSGTCAKFPEGHINTSECSCFEKPNGEDDLDEDGFYRYNPPFNSKPTCPIHGGEQATKAWFAQHPPKQAGFGWIGEFEAEADRPLSEQTPAEIDTEYFPLAAKHNQLLTRSLQYNQIVNDPKTADYQRQQYRDLRDDHRAQADEVKKQMLPHEAEFQRRGGWERYQWCQSDGGHLHKSVPTCHTLTPGKSLVSMDASASGLQEPELVEKYGYGVCTHCFKSAPTHPAYLKGEAEAQAAEQAKIDARCPGSGTRDHDSSHMRNYRAWATCDHCGQGTSVTSTGKLRAHKPQKMTKKHAMDGYPSEDAGSSRELHPSIKRWADRYNLGVHLHELPDLMTEAGEPDSDAYAGGPDTHIFHHPDIEQDHLDAVACHELAHEVQVSRGRLDRGGRDTVNYEQEAWDLGRGLHNQLGLQIPQEKWDSYANPSVNTYKAVYNRHVPERLRFPLAKKAHSGDDLGFHDESESWEDRAQDRGMWGSNPVPAQDNKEEGVCRHCQRRIIHDEKDGWVDPEATGDDAVWRDMCDSHDTVGAEHEPEGPYYDEDDDPNGMKTAGYVPCGCHRGWVDYCECGYPVGMADPRLMDGTEWEEGEGCPSCGNDDLTCRRCNGSSLRKTALLDYDPVRDVQPSSNSAPAPDATKAVGDPWPNQVHDGVNPDRPGYIFDKKLKKFIRDEQLTYPDVGPTFPGVTDINKVGHDDDATHMLCWRCHGQPESSDWKQVRYEGGTPVCVTCEGTGLLRNTPWHHAVRHLKEEDYNQEVGASSEFHKTIALGTPGGAMLVGWGDDGWFATADPTRPYAPVGYHAARDNGYPHLGWCDEHKISGGHSQNFDPHDLVNFVQKVRDKYNPPVQKDAATNPYEVCQDCYGKDPNCETCGGSGFLRHELVADPARPGEMRCADPDCDGRWFKKEFVSSKAAPYIPCRDCGGRNGGCYTCRDTGLMRMCPKGCGHTLDDWHQEDGTCLGRDSEGSFCKCKQWITDWNDDDEDLARTGQAYPQPVGMHEGDNGIDDPMKHGDPSQVKKIIPGTQKTVPETNVWNVSIDNLNKTGASNEAARVQGQAQQAADVDGEREPEEPKLTDRQLHVMNNHPMMAEEIASIEELTAFADPELQQLHLQDHALNQHDHNPEVLRVAKRSS